MQTREGKRGDVPKGRMGAAQERRLNREDVRTQMPDRKGEVYEPRTIQSIAKE